MAKYTPPPEDLSRLNPIQRYMQKGELEGWDWVYLILLVLVYFAARPSIQRFVKWWLADEDLKEGEKAQAEFLRSKAKAKVGPNAIRGTETQPTTALPNTSGDKATGSSLDNKSTVVNRKTKDKSGTDVLLDWDDQPERNPTEGDKNDVVAWMDKWANEE